MKAGAKVLAVPAASLSGAPCLQTTQGRTLAPTGPGTGGWNGGLRRLLHSRPDNVAGKRIEMTLLEQAKRNKRQEQHPQVDADELLEMALAAITGEITVAQAQRTLYPSKSTSGYHQLSTSRLWGSIRTAVADGRIRIEKQNKEIR